VDEKINSHHKQRAAMNHITITGSFKTIGIGVKH
jgi:hypothetical protein